MDTLEYYDFEMRRVVELAFKLARSRNKKVTSVDKANVLETSRLWRQIATALGKANPDVALDHMLVDTASMRLITSPASFDVVVTENMFGDILTDEASVLAGSMGMLPSALASATAAPACTSPSTARRRTSPARASQIRSARSSPRPCCSATRSASTPRRPPSRRRSTAPSPRAAAPATWEARSRPAQMTDEVLRRL